jgi:hypothetical protein
VGDEGKGERRRGKNEGKGGRENKMGVNIYLILK